MSSERYVFSKLQYFVYRTKQSFNFYVKQRYCKPDCNEGYYVPGWGGLRLTCEGGKWLTQDVPYTGDNVCFPEGKIFDITYILFKNLLNNNYIYLVSRIYKL